MQTLVLTLRNNGPPENQGLGVLPYLCGLVDSVSICPAKRAAEKQSKGVISALNV